MPSAFRRSIRFPGNDTVISRQGSIQRRTASAVSAGLLLKQMLAFGAHRWIRLVIFEQQQTFRRLAQSGADHYAVEVF
jgi:hypothetical protein